jgi:hypothetical protein
MIYSFFEKKLEICFNKILFYLTGSGIILNYYIDTLEGASV